jgi:hypothetical protein
MESLIKTIRMKKNLTFEQEALQNVQNAVREYSKRKGLQLSHSIYPIIFSDDKNETALVDHKPELKRVWH